MTKILIVEDEVIIADDIKESLEILGYESLSAVSSGKEAIERVNLEMPDIVLMDIRLRDEMDGIEAAERIYSSYRVPVIFLTAYSDDSLIERAKRVGPFGYLIKPFDSRELKAMIEMALYKVKIEQESLAVEKKALMAQKYESLRTLAGGIAHNFNNLLSGVLGNIELALRKMESNECPDDLIKKAQKSAQSAAELSWQMLSYVGQCHEQLEILDIVKTITDLVDILQVSCLGKAQFEFTTSAEPIYINSSPALLSQVVNNLVANSLEAFDDKEGKIGLSVGRIFFKTSSIPQTFQTQNMQEGEYAFVRIEDNGCGIEQEIVSRVFDPFFTTKFTGRGLGLPAALGVMQAHGGTILIEKSSPKGTVIQAYFPVSFSPETKKNVDKRTVLKNWKGRGKVLLVHNEDASMELCQALLKEWGFDILIAVNSSEALNIFRTHYLDIRCVILDIVAPWIESVRLFQELKQINKDVYTIFLSGYCKERALSLFKDDKPDFFLEKPFNILKFQKVVQEVIN